MHIQQPFRELPGLLARIHSHPHRVSNIVAKADALIQIFDFFIGTGWCRIDFVPRPVIVNGHLNIVLFNLLIYKRQQLRRRDADNDLHPGGFGVIKGIVHLVFLLHRDYSAAVEYQSRLFNFCHDVPDLSRRTVQR